MLLRLLIALLVLIYGLAVLFQLPEIRTDKYAKDLWIYGVLMALSLAFGVALALDFSLPTPTDLINKLISGFARRFMEVNRTLP